MSELEKIAENCFAAAKQAEKHHRELEKLKILKLKNEEANKVTAFIQNFVNDEKNEYRMLIESAIKNGQTKTSVTKMPNHIRLGLRQMGFWVIEEHLRWSDNLFHIYFNRPTWALIGLYSKCLIPFIAIALFVYAMINAPK